MNCYDISIGSLATSGTIVLGNDDEDFEDYNNLLKNTKWINTILNANATEEESSGDCSVGVIVDKFGNNNGQRLILIQRVKKLHAWDIITAIMIMDLQDGQARFAVRPNVTDARF
ncbi:hypothetical protein I4U23_015645 [Adineta vaga]|nr:hypothetical protein I4U23_015645 [Adineta vaga]